MAHQIYHNKVPLKMTSSKLSFHFQLRDQEGNLIDSSYDSNQPIKFELGKKELFPAILEKKIATMQVGDKQTFDLSAKEAFGERDESRVAIVPISDIRLSHEGQNIERGQKVFLHIPDTNPEDDHISFTVTAVMNGMVALDGNHPLAGQDLSFEIELLDTPEALEV